MSKQKAHSRKAILKKQITALKSLIRIRLAGNDTSSVDISYIQDYLKQLEYLIDELNG